jgi:6-pyruvoyltetrahydropterin/6-carboxytetrahydropterin synthase
MFTVYKKFEFASAHQLEGHEKCGKLHGHNYTIEAWVSSINLIKPHNFVIDFHEFSNIAKEYDHNGKILKISSEMLAKEIAKKIANKSINPKEVKVKVWESDHTYAEYLLVVDF